MSEEELEDLLSIGCCKYHEEIGEKAKKEIERLNNIINELEKWLEEYIELLKQPDSYEEQTLEDLREVLDKLKELKENSNA